MLCSNLLIFLPHYNTNTNTHTQCTYAESTKTHGEARGRTRRTISKFSRFNKLQRQRVDNSSSLDAQKKTAREIYLIYCLNT